MEEPTSNRRARGKLPSRACEACRVAKIRCQPGPQSDICKRCSSNKRECVFRTGLRTRRSKAVDGATPPSPPPGPSQSFTIDFAAPAEKEEDSASFLEDIEKFHEAAMEELLPGLSRDDGDPSMAAAGPAGPGPGSGSGSGFASPASLAAGPGSGGAGGRSLHALGLQPRFNLQSAQTLLDRFRDMLPHFPVLAWPGGADVKSLAKSSPFLLLAVLAAVSCSVNLQGHGLYDEEFRKVLGLKFVTGAERSLELLQGVLIYLAWYPHHLRPKSPIRNQHMRIATDIVRDLNLDQDTAFADRPATGLTHQDAQSIRALIACFYLDSAVSNCWQRPSSFPSTQWIMRCCDLLEQHSPLDQDHTLVWLARLGHATGETIALHKRAQKTDAQDEHQLRLLHLGHGAQLQEWQARMPATVAARPNAKLALAVTASFHAAAPLLKLKPDVAAAATGPLPLDAARLTQLAHTLRTALDAAAAMGPAALDRLCACDWYHLVAVIIVALRLTLPVAGCPGFDAARARSVLELGAYFARFGSGNDDDGGGGGGGGSSSCSRASSQAAATTTTPSTENGDDAGAGATTSHRGRGGAAARKPGTATCASAFRVILRALKTKYEARVAAAEAQEELARASFGCPMMDGSLTDYLPLWDSQGAFVEPAVSATTMQQQQQQQQQGFPEPLVFDDLWATMTMGWAAEDVFDSGPLAQQGQSGIL